MSAFMGSGTLWFVFGVVLLVVEAMHTGVLAVFFAFGAWVTAILLWMGIIESSTFQLAVFLVVSLLSLFFLRQRMRTWLTGLRHSAGEDMSLDDFAGNLATVVEPIEPGKKPGKVEFRGTQWPARSDVTIARGTVVRILARDNITLSVKPNEEAGKS